MRRDYPDTIAGEDKMFITLLVVTFLIALTVSFAVARLFRAPVQVSHERAPS
jgi:hypothetical protein